MQDLKKVAKIGKLKLFQPGEVLFMQGAEGDCMYIVTKGVFGVYINSFTDFPAKVAEIPAGAYFGEMSVIDGSPRSATIVSEEQGTAVAIDKAHFKELIDENPDIAIKILGALNSRYESTSNLAVSKGKAVEPLPSEYVNPQNKPPETYLTSMVYLAGKLRELNDLLNPQKKEEKIEMKETVNAVRLLPSGHERVDYVDEYDNSKIFSNLNCVCPYCDYDFKGKTPIFSRLTIAEKTPDFRNIYEKFNMPMYVNIVCPNCNYCDHYQEFRAGRAVANIPKVKGNQFINEEGFTGFKDEYKHTADEAILSYYLNIECLRQIPKSELRMGKAWQRLYWLYNDLGLKHRAGNAALKAVESFGQFMYRDGEFLDTEKYLTLNVIMGELNIVIGKKDVAMECFKKNTNIAGYKTHELVVRSVQKFRELRDS